MKWAQPKECAGPYCDRKLYAVRSDARFCSDTCRQQAHRKKRADAQAPVTAVTANSPVVQGIPAVTAVTANSPVAQGIPAVTAVTANPVEGDLDAEIAELAEKIRRALWHAAALHWRSHYEQPWTPPFEDEDRPAPALIYVWQKLIDTGRAQPVTKYIRFADFHAPDVPWPGLGLDNRDADPDCQDWWTVWGIVDIYIPGVLDQARRLQRRWVEREVHRLLMEGVDIDSLFDKDGDWKSEDQEVMLIWGRKNSNYIEVPKPTFFTDDLVHKEDPWGAPDFARGWWDDPEDEDPAGSAD